MEFMKQTIGSKEKYQRKNISCFWSLLAVDTLLSHLLISKDGLLEFCFPSFSSWLLIVTYNQLPAITIPQSLGKHYDHLPS